MAVSYQPVSQRDLARGLDLRAVQNALPEGYSERARNITFSSSGHASKRVGYQGYYGNLPFRVTEVRHAGTSIRFLLDSSVDTSVLESTPLVVYGRLSTGGTGDWSTTSVARYYPTYTTDIPDTVPAGPYTFNLPGARYASQYGTPLFTSMLATSPDPFNHSSSWFVAEDVRVDQTAPYDINIDTNFAALSRVFYYATDKQGVGGDSYVQTSALPQITTGTVGGAGATITDAAHDYIVGDVLTFDATSLSPIVPGQEYVVATISPTTYTLSGVVFAGAGTVGNTTAKRTFTILQAVHNLNTFKIIPQFQILQTQWEYVYPELSSIDRSTGSITVQLTTSDVSQGRTCRFIYSAALNANEHAFGSTTTTFTLQPDFYHFSLNSVSGSVDTMILPDTLSKVDGTEQATLDVLTAGTYKFWFEPATVLTSALIVEDTTATAETYTDLSPQLTIWGLDHSGVYINPDAQGGHVTHLDSYRSPAESRLVSGLGGNLFTAKTFEEAGVTYSMPQSSVDLQVRTGGVADVVIQPAMVYTDVVSMVYNGTPGQVVVTFVGPLPTFSTSSSDPDLLTIQGAAHAVHNGTWTILAQTSTTITISNPSVVLADFDELSGAQAGVFTATLTTFEPSELQVGDLLAIDAVTDDAFTVVSWSAGLTSVRVSGVTQAFTIPPNTLVQVTRTSSTFPLLSSRNFVAGDMVQIDALTREARVLRVDAVSSLRFVSLVHVGTTATVTTESPHNYLPGDVVFVNGTGNSDYNGVRTILTIPTTVTFTFTASSSVIGPLTLANVGRSSTYISTFSVALGIATATTGSFHRLKIGDVIEIIATTGGFSGLKTVTSVPSSSTFTFATTETSGAGVTGFIRGGTITIDEDLTVTDTGSSPTSATVGGRWIPVEAPTSVDDLVPPTITYHFDSNAYDRQPIMRSSEVADSLFLTNNSDEVWKFDGSSLYQAGLPRWQSQLFLALDTDNATIPLGTSIPFTARDTTNNFYTALEVSQYSVGDRIVDSNDTASTTPQIMTITAINPTDKKIYVDDAFGAGTAAGTLSKVRRYTYYARLSAIDANNNLLASAVTGASDSVIDLSRPSSIEVKLVPPTAWTTLDFDTIEVELYRTKSDTVAPFYLTRRLDVRFNALDKYILITDGQIDDFLVDLDNVNTTLLGAELGTAWTQPPRAKYVTSINNRLVMANLRDYSQVDLTLRKKAGTVSLGAADLTGKIITFKRDVGDALVPTDMTNRVRFEYVTTADERTAAITAPTSNEFRVTVGSAFTPTPVAGDWLYLYHSATGTNNSLKFAGWWQIKTAVSTTVFDVRFNHDGSLPASGVNRAVVATDPTDVPVLTSTDGNYNQIGLNDGTEFEAILRLAGAINSTQRGASETTGFTPWLFAAAGSEIGLGRLVVRQERVESTNFSVTLPAAITSADFFADGVQQAASASVPSSRRLFPSRLVVSYENFPELFDNPFGAASESDSVVDVNSADGQEITGVIPFFGESSFASSNSALEFMLVVFKTNSIYLVDLSVNVDTGLPRRTVTKIQSRGLGCTAPFSIAVTQSGIMFANESGIYRLGQDQKVVYVGKFIERLWQDEVNRVDLSKLAGHNFSIGNQYKLSVPVGNSTQTLNNEVVVYDHEREGRDQELGAWSEYLNHGVTMWANLINDAYFASYVGRVFKIRRANDATDYRDDNIAIPCDLILRATDFGNAGTRKVVNSVTSHLQLRHSSQTGTMLENSTDLDGEFQSCGALTAEDDGVTKVATLRSALPRRKAVYHQLRYTNDIIDEEFILSGVDWWVAGLNDRGVREAAD